MKFEINATEWYRTRRNARMFIWPNIGRRLESRQTVLPARTCVLKVREIERFVFGGRVVEAVPVITEEWGPEIFYLLTEDLINVPVRILYPKAA